MPYNSLVHAPTLIDIKDLPLVSVHPFRNIRIFPQSLHGLADTLEGIAVIVGMLLFEVERGSETSGAFTAGALVNTLAFESEHELVADGGRLTREGEIGPQAARLGNAFRVLGFELKQAILEVGTRPCSDLI